MLLIGLMSGTSADGIDAALVEITGQGRRTYARLLHFLCLPHTEAMREAILRLCDPQTATVPDLCALNVALGERFAEAAQAVAGAAAVALSEVDAIASHGQTVWHQPTPRPIAGMEARGTLQIGEPAVIAARTGCRVVSHFRTADMAAGGHGAPLVPYADWALLTSGREHRVVLNIGGIANVTFLPRNAAPEAVIAFDTGPGNMVIDGLVRALTRGARQFDAGGAWAAQGTPLPRLWNPRMEHPYFLLDPPKTTGREMFGEQYVHALLADARTLGAREEDVLATATFLTARTIGFGFRTFVRPRTRSGRIGTVIVGGGGTQNATLLRMIREEIAPTRVTTHAEFGIPDDAKEAIAFALLGYETLQGRPSNLPTATGAARPTILGSITPKSLET